jgi:hypothetical protein
MCTRVTFHLMSLHASAFPTHLRVNTPPHPHTHTHTRTWNSTHCTSIAVKILGQALSAPEDTVATKGGTLFALLHGDLKSPPVPRASRATAALRSAVLLAVVSRVKLLCSELACNHLHVFSVLSNQRFDFLLGGGHVEHSEVLESSVDKGEVFILVRRECSRVQIGAVFVARETRRLVPVIHAVTKHALPLGHELVARMQSRELLKLKCAVMHLE